MDEECTLKSATLTRMKHVYSLAEDFTAKCRDKSEVVMKSFDISGSELALNLGHTAIFKGLLCSASRRELYGVCYTAFYKFYQDLAVLDKETLFLRDECRGLAHTFHQQHVKYGYSLPELSEVELEVKLDGLMRIFVTEDPMFIDMFHGHPPKALVKAARDYELSLELYLSLDDLGEFLWNNIE